jgi:hypothetical protein
VEREDIRDELSRGVNFPGRLTRSVGVKSQASQRGRPESAARASLAVCACALDWNLARETLCETTHLTPGSLFSKEGEKWATTPSRFFLSVPWWAQPFTILSTGEVLIRNEHLDSADEHQPGRTGLDKS